MHTSFASRLCATAAAAALVSIPLCGVAPADSPEHRGKGHPKAKACSATPPVAGKKRVFAEEFDGPINWGERWSGTGTSAYKYGDHNDWYSLDWVTPDAVTVANGEATFTATPSEHVLENGKRAWDTGLLTTENTRESFTVQDGDYVETRVMLPTQTGAWPALWTWTVDRPHFRGNNEIDTFEYHPDAGNEIELTNHIRYSSHSYKNSEVVAPGKWITVGTYFGKHSIDWYVNGKNVFCDGKGIPAAWRGFPVLNLSIADGTHHPVPTGDKVTYSADYVRVHR